MSESIKVIDLFAGPGGLGEGFSAFKTPEGRRPFKIVASVEKEASAHKTLTLRAFYRQFLGRDTPPEYYEYLRNSSKVGAEQFFSEQFPEEWAAAKRETLGGPKALGSDDHDIIFSAIEEQIAGHTGKRIVIGGPPCQAYSLVGRARNKAIKGYVAAEDHRHFLYKEYLKVLDLVQPDIFVMENVKGILTAKVNGESIFEKIREDLACPARAINSARAEIEYVLLPFAHPLEDRNVIGSFQNKDFVIRAEEFGIPQARHRVILLGVRSDVLPNELAGELLSEWRQDNQVTVGEVLANLPRLRSGLSRTQPNDFQKWKNNFEKGFLKVYTELAFSTEAQDKAKWAFDAATADLTQGGRYVPLKRKHKNRLPDQLQKWYADEHLLGFVNHEARNHMAEDLHRYLYASCYAAAQGGISPRSRDYPERLTPKQKH